MFLKEFKQISPKQLFFNEFGKILYKKGKSSKKGKQVSIPDTGYEERHKLPQLGFRAKFGKCVGPACSSPPSPLNNRS